MATPGSLAVVRPFLKQRSDCARLAGAGHIRINRQPTEKPHARLRPGTVLTLALRGEVRVIRVLALGTRRGPATEARLLYEEIREPPASQDTCAAGACVAGES